MGEKEWNCEVEGRFVRLFFFIFVALCMVGCDGANYQNQPLIPTTETPVLEVGTDTPAKVASLSRLAVALEKYKRKNHAYPASTKKGSVWYWDGDYQNKEWIKDLSPGYISHLPRDNNPSGNTDAYSYISNGANYKLLAINAEDCQEVVAKYPQLKDRGRVECAYGYWTSVAAGWQSQSL